MPSMSTGDYQEKELRVVGGANASLCQVVGGRPAARRKGRDRVPAVRCRRVLLAGLLASSAAVGAARADPPGPAAPTQPQPPTPAPKDLRDTFGLTRPPATRVDCGDGLA